MAFCRASTELLIVVMDNRVDLQHFAEHLWDNASWTSKCWSRFYSGATALLCLHSMCRRESQQWL